MVEKDMLDIEKLQTRAVKLETRMDMCGYSSTAKH